MFPKLETGALQKRLNKKIYCSNYQLYKSLGINTYFHYIPSTLIFVMAKIQRIGHDHQAPFSGGESSGDARRKQAAT